MDFLISLATDLKLTPYRRVTIKHSEIALATVISLSCCHNDGSVHIKVTKPSLLLACSNIWRLLSMPLIFYCRFREGWLVRKGTFFSTLCVNKHWKKSICQATHIPLWTNFNLKTARGWAGEIPFTIILFLYNAPKNNANLIQYSGGNWICHLLSPIWLRSFKMGNHVSQ